MTPVFFFDGGGSHNGSHAGWGWVCYLDGEEYWVGRGALPPGTTNNVAEYTALLHAATFAVAHDWSYHNHGVTPQHFVFHGDSDLVVSQVLGVYTVRSAHLRHVWSDVMHALEPLDYEISWVPRRENARADMLATEGKTWHRMFTAQKVRT